MVAQIVKPAVFASDIANVRRGPRRPQHTFNVISKVMEITPIMFAPVLPGETMTNLLMQSRAVTDPIHNRLVGWHKEYYFFYVPLPALKRDWDTNGLLQSMMLDPTTNTAALKAGANSVPYNTFKGGFGYQSQIVQLLTKEFFRDEGESASPSGEMYPYAKVNQANWLDSFKLESATGDDLELPGVDEIEELDILPGFTTAYAQWEIMRDNKMTDLDYDDFIRSYGVDIPKSEEIQPDANSLVLRPELIRFSRNWQYPSNTIDPADGSATSAVSWSIAERADKRRFFKYPGFIVGLTVTRPKLYLGNVKGAAIGFLDNAYAWLPAVLHGHVYASIKEIEDSATDGPLQNQTEDYWFDVKDLFLHGDQFVNHAITAASAHKIDLPTSTGGIKYITEAMGDALFVGDTNSSYIREDGVVHLNILGKLSETTP